MESARTATRQDRERLAELCAAAEAEIAGHRGGRRLLASARHPAAPPARGRHEPAAGDTAADRLTVVGCIDGVVVGFARAALERGAGPAVAVVEAIYVEPAARAVGVGEAMMTKVLRWAGARGCSGVDAPALPGSREAKAFFEDTGFVTRLLIMHRPLAARGSGSDVPAPSGGGTESDG